MKFKALFLAAVLAVMPRAAWAVTAADLEGYWVNTDTGNSSTLKVLAFSNSFDPTSSDSGFCFIIFGYEAFAHPYQLLSSSDTSYIITDSGIFEIWTLESNSMKLQYVNQLPSDSIESDFYIYNGRTFNFERK